jgi:hypothetical protein
MGISVLNIRARDLAATLPMAVPGYARVSSREPTPA